MIINVLYIKICVFITTLSSPYSSLPGAPAQWALRAQKIQSPSSWFRCSGSQKLGGTISGKILLSFCSPGMEPAQSLSGDSELWMWILCVLKMFRTAISEAYNMAPLWWIFPGMTKGTSLPWGNPFCQITKVSAPWASQLNSCKNFSNMSKTTYLFPNLVLRNSWTISAKAFQKNPASGRHLTWKNFSPNGYSLAKFQLYITVYLLNILYNNIKESSW